MNGRVKHKMIARKAQIKIQETAFVLLAIVLLFSIVFLFYFKIHSLDIAKRATASKEERALSMLDKIASMPEISCSSYIGERTESICIDKDKLIVFKDMRNYKQMWTGLKEVSISEVYPMIDKYVIYSADNTEKQTYNNFISLCEQQQTGYSCTIGIISIAI